MKYIYIAVSPCFYWYIKDEYTESSMKWDANYYTKTCCLADWFAAGAQVYVYSDVYVLSDNTSRIKLQQMLVLAVIATPIARSWSINSHFFSKNSTPFFFPPCQQCHMSLFDTDSNVWARSLSFSFTCRGKLVKPWRRGILHPHPRISGNHRLILQHELTNTGCFVCSSGKSEPLVTSLDL